MDVTRNTQTKHILRALFHYTLEETDVVSALERSWAGIDPELRKLATSANAGRHRLMVLALGKAALPMAAWLLDESGRSMVPGVLSAPSVPDKKWRGLYCFAGGHPVPNRESLDAARQALDMVRGATAEDLVLFLISGGGSSLFELPLYHEITLTDLCALYGTLVRCGAPIVDVNTVRKHLSAVKGGRLAVAAAPARQLTLYISDVPRGQESSVASGPTTPDGSTLADFRRIVSDYELDRQFTAAVARFLGQDAPLPETPKSGDPAFSKCAWVRVLDNDDAIQAACRFAESQGWSTVTDLSVDDVDLVTAVEQLIARLESLESAAPENKPVCIVSGGELSVRVRGDGVGGRNQAFVLECVRRIAGKRLAVLSAGTDGIDGNSPAAGAVADGWTLERAESLGLDPDRYIERSDSYSFFNALGDVITCGATQNNLRDVRVLVSW